VTEINAAILTRLGTPQGADIAADLLTLIGYVDSLETRLPANLTAPTGPPSATATPAEALAWLLTLARNKMTQTSTTQTLLADNGTTTVATSTVSDDGTTFTRGEWS